MACLRGYRKCFEVHEAVAEGVDAASEAQEAARVEGSRALESSALCFKGEGGGRAGGGPTSALPGRQLTK